MPTMKKMPILFTERFTSIKFGCHNPAVCCLLYNFGLAEQFSFLSPDLHLKCFLRNSPNHALNSILQKLFKLILGHLAADPAARVFVAALQGVHVAAASALLSFECLFKMRKLGRTEFGDIDAGHLWIVLGFYL